MAEASMKHELLLLSDGTWARTRGRLEGLTDDELRWEPAPGCWTVRPLADGTWVSDWAMPPPAAAPFTTIAWRLCHLIGCYGSVRNSAWLDVTVEEAPIESWVTPAPHTAEAAIALLEAAHGRWRAVLEASTDVSLATSIGAIGGHYADASRAGLVIHQLDEIIHHAAEIAVLRDLWRAQHQPPHDDPAVVRLLAGDTAAFDDVADPDALVSALAELGRFDLVEAAVARGLPVDGPPPTAHHRAATVGRIEVVDQLLAAGASKTVTDPQYRATPAVWAEFFGHAELAERLRPAD
jgi:hypothetical protein